MRIIHLSYNIPIPQYDDPEAWFNRINFSIGVFEAMTQYADVDAIFNINYRGVIRRNGVTYHFPSYGRFQLLLPIEFNRYVKKIRPEVVIVHGLIFPWQVLMLYWQLGGKVKIILQHHAERPLRDIRQYLQRWLDKYVSAYLFASKEQGMDWVRKRQIADERKIKEIMGTSSPFTPMENGNGQRDTKPGNSITFLWVGDLNANKDPLLVVNAFGDFVKTGAAAQLKMIYQTNGLLEQLKTTINERQLDNYIQLVGKVAYRDLQFWYNSADFIISSSHYEGSGIAVCEAMSCGCIPILTDIPSFRMMTDNGKIGMLYNVGDRRTLLDCLINSQAIDIIHEKKRVLKRFQEELSFDANARKIMDVIREG